ncbi:MAG: hypothetical protein JNL82_39695 [Myxococcales bacterium]|nr:hypothetical protein [Myxococcales bacterium]
MVRLDSLLGLARGLLPACVGTVPATLPGGLGRFPPCLSWLGVEVRLDDDATVDLAASVDGRGAGRLVLAASEVQLRADLPAQWGATLAAIGDWAAARDPGLAAVQELWFEVDAGGELRPPIVFFTVVGALPDGVDALLDAAVLPRLGAPPEALERLRTARAGWTSDVRVHHLASLAPRGRGGLRVVASAPTDALMATLRGLGWADDTAVLDALLAALGDWTGRVSFDLDLDADAPRRLGIEWHLLASPRTDPRWQRALAAAQELAGARPEKVEAAREWAEDITLGERVTIHRYMHLKFVVRPDVPLTSKAYLGLAPRLHADGPS